jgi:alkanesulfonate monooxygenase SsuD/methylene tetrahydromethanopterin reductase-like flavin-dependent oxidoreductase (luciferase family)
MKVGAILPMSGPEEGIAMSYRTIRSLAMAVEQSSLDSAWVYDHLINRFPEKPQGEVQEAWTVLTALAEATERVDLGCLVFCVPFRNPALLAKMAVALDDVSDGRLILGLGAGWHKPEFDAFGYPFDHLVDRFEEGLNIIVPLLRDGAVDFTGSYYAAPNCEMAPRPKRQIPILIASFKPRMLALTARYADAWNTAWLGHVDALSEQRAALEEACRAEGRDPGTLEVTVGLNVRFPELLDEAERNEEIDQAKVISGGVDEVAAALRAYRDAGVGHLICALSPLTEEAIASLSRAWDLARA